MPSYDAISDAKNTKESLSTLLIEETTAAVRAPKAAMKGPSLGSVLPSMNKEGPKKKAPKATVAPGQEKEDKRLEKIKIVDTNMPTYSDATESKGKNPFAL